MKIESLDNKKVKNWTKLKEKKYRDQNGLFLIEGNHLIEEASKYNVIVEIITTDESLSSEIYPIYYVSEAVMKKLSFQVTSSNICAVCKKLEENEINSSCLILDGIQDPGNLGTMIRSAVAFNVNHLVLGFDCVDLYNEKVIRASEGMLFHLNIIRTDLTAFINEIKQKDYHVYKTDVENGKHVNQTKFSKKSAVIIGNEGNGVSEAIKKLVPDSIYIPMNDNCESLNAGVSASIIMYEMGNQNE